MKKKVVMFLLTMMITAAAFSVSTVSVNAAELTEEQQLAIAESVASIATNPQAVQVINTIFDAEYYAITYPDVVAIVGNDAQALFAHYISFGIIEGRDASATFNLDAYVAANPDLVDAFTANGMELNAINFINHYAVSGINEERVSTVAGAIEKGVAVASLTNPKVVIAQPVAKVPQKKVWATGGGGGGSAASTSDKSDAAEGENNSSSARDTLRKKFPIMPEEVINALSDEDVQIILNNPNAVIGSDNKVYASQEEWAEAAMESYVANNTRSFDNGISYNTNSLLGYLDGVAIYVNEGPASSLGESYVTEDGQYANLTYNQFMAFMDALSDKNHAKACEEANAYGTIYNNTDGTVYVERWDGTKEQVQSADVNDKGNVVITYLDGTVYEQIIEYTPSEPVIPHLNSSDIPEN